MYVVVPVAIVVGRWGGSLGSRSLYLCDRKENQTNDKERPKGGGVHRRRIHWHV